MRILISAIVAILIFNASGVLAESPEGKGNNKDPKPSVLVIRDANQAFVGHLLRLVSDREVKIVYRGDPALCSPTICPPHRHQLPGILSGG